jgi:hypothetical protein
VSTRSVNGKGNKASSGYSFYIFTKITISISENEKSRPGPRSIGDFIATLSGPVGWMDAI